MLASKKRSVKAGCLLERSFVAFVIKVMTTFKRLRKSAVLSLMIDHSFGRWSLAFVILATAKGWQ